MLVVKPSNSMRYALLYDKTQVYLVDTMHTEQLFSLPKTPEKTTLQAYLLKRTQISNFEIDAKKNSGTLNTVLITQPFVAFIYNVGKHLFQGFEDRYYVLIKFMLLVIALGITLLANQLFLNSQKKRVTSHLSAQNKVFTLKCYKTEKSKLRPVNYVATVIDYAFTTVAALGPLYLYFKENSGIESVMLVVISLVFFYLYLYSKHTPIALPAFKNYDFSLEEISK